jgi:hypothetical protein
MRIASQLINLLSVPLGGDIEVPELIQAIGELQLPLQAGAYGVSQDLRGRVASSLVWNVFARAGVQAGGEFTLATFDKGTYEIDCMSQIYADFVEAVADAPQQSVFLESPGGGAAEILTATAYTGAPRTDYAKVHVTFSQVGWTLKMSDGATLAGQNRSFYVRAYIRKLL